MFNLIKKKNKQKKGVTLLETALVFPIILIFIGIMITGSQLVTNKMVLNYAISVGARQTEGSRNAAQAASRATKTAKEILQQNGINIENIKIDCKEVGTGGQTSDMKITASTSYVNLFPTYNGTSFSNGNGQIQSTLVFTWKFDKKGHTK